MKLLLIFAVATLLGLFSCKKDYSCVCSSSVADYEAAYFEDKTLFEAKDECADYEESDDAKKLEGELGEDLSCAVE